VSRSGGSPGEARITTGHDDGFPVALADAATPRHLAVALWNMSDSDPNVTETAPAAWTSTRPLVVATMRVLTDDGVRVLGSAATPTFALVSGSLDLADPPPNTAPTPEMIDPREGMVAFCAKGSTGTVSFTYAGLTAEIALTMELQPDAGCDP
jgi:hypothetical protein